MGYYLLICLSCFFFKIHGVVLSLSQSVTLPSRIMDCQLLIAFHVSPWDCMQHLFAFTRSCFALENMFMVVLTNKNIEKGILHRDGFFDILIHLCSTWVPRSVIFKQKFNKCDNIYSPWDRMQHLFAFTFSCFALENEFMVVLTNKNIEKVSFIGMGSLTSSYEV